MTNHRTYWPADPRLEARSRLISLLSVCEHELASLEALGEPALSGVVEQMQALHAQLLAALDAFPAPADAP
jgi:hypothetical protein